MIENQISSVFFILLITGLSYIEVRRFKNLITPFTVSAFPLAFIILIVNFLFIYQGVKPVTIRVIFFLSLCLILIWIVGYFFSRDYKLKAIVSSEYSDIASIFKKFERYKYFLMAIALLIAFISYIRVISVVGANGGWFYLGTDDFEKEMTKGITAHLTVFGMAVFVLLYLITKNSKRKFFNYIVLLFLGVSVFFLMVKYYLLWLIMIVFFINNFNKPISVQLKRIIRISILLAIIFITYFIFLSIFWKTFSVSNTRIWEYFYKMFLNYLITGPIVLDKWLNTPGIKPDWTLFIVPINLFNVLLSNPFRVNLIALVSTGFESLGGGLFSNVGTSFGVYYLIGGLPFTVFMTILFSVFSYFIYFKGLFSKNSIHLFLLWFILSINTLNFFGPYITIVSFYEFPLFFILLITALKFINKSYFMNTRNNLVNLT